MVFVAIAIPARTSRAAVTPQQAALQRWYKFNQAAEFAVDNLPFDMTFDGEHMWVSLFVLNAVQKVRASDGALLGRFPVGQRPVALLFDGTNMWTANETDGTVKLSLGGGRLGTFALASPASPSILAFDGANLWSAGGSNKLLKH
jgi:hypothetical protein